MFFITSCRLGTIAIDDGSYLDREPAPFSNRTSLSRVLENMIPSIVPKIE